MSSRARIALLAGVVAIAVVAFVIAQPGNDNGSSNDTNKSSDNAKTTQQTAPAPPVQIVVRGGKPVGGIKKITLNQGDRLRFTVTSDVADEVHVHGYDFMKDVPAGGTVRFDFPAKISGSFDVELEQRAEQIASLRVEP